MHTPSRARLIAVSLVISAMALLLTSRRQRAREFDRFLNPELAGRIEVAPDISERWAQVAREPYEETIASLQRWVDERHQLMAGSAVAIYRNVPARTTRRP